MYLVHEMSTTELAEVQAKGPITDKRIAMFSIALIVQLIK
jgi:hypothetical protein